MLPIVPLLLLLLQAPRTEEFPGPSTPAAQPEWLSNLKRQQRKPSPHYDRPELQWTQRNFIQTLMLVEDRYFYDPETRKYTVDRYIDDLEKRYGGIDSVLVWHTYPNIGIDNRNQNDHLNDLPGGLPGVRQMVADFHRRGVRVLFPLMPWDQGTREDTKQNTPKLFADLGIDGVFGDTMRGLPPGYERSALALEPENGLDSDDFVT